MQMEPTLVVSMGGHDVPTEKSTVQEMRQVKIWTTFSTRKEWFAAILKEDPDALIAAYCVALRRQGTDVKFSDADFDLDTLTARLVAPDGREIEPKLEKNKDGTLKLDEKQQPVPCLTRKGEQIWLYTETGDVVPPTEPAPTT